MRSRSSSEGRTGPLTFRPDPLPLLVWLGLLQVALGILFCGPLLLTRARSASPLSAASMVGLYALLMILGIWYYRNHPRVRSRYILNDKGLRFCEVIGDASVPRRPDRFFPWVEIASVEVTPQGKIELRDVGGGTVVTSWKVKRATELRNTAIQYLS